MKKERHLRRYASVFNHRLAFTLAWVLLTHGGTAYSSGNKGASPASASPLIHLIHSMGQEPVVHLSTLLPDFDFQEHIIRTDLRAPLARKPLHRSVKASKNQTSSIRQIISQFSENPNESTELTTVQAALRQLYQNASDGDSGSRGLLRELGETNFDQQFPAPIRRSPRRHASSPLVPSTAGLVKRETYDYQLRDRHQTYLDPGTLYRSNKEIRREYKQPIPRRSSGYSPTVRRVIQVGLAAIMVGRTAADMISSYVHMSPPRVVNDSTIQGTCDYWQPNGAPDHFSIHAATTVNKPICQLTGSIICTPNAPCVCDTPDLKMAAFSRTMPDGSIKLEYSAIPSTNKPVTFICTSGDMSRSVTAAGLQLHQIEKRQVEPNEQTVLFNGNFTKAIRSNPGGNFILGENINVTDAQNDQFPLQFDAPLSNTLSNATNGSTQTFSGSIHHNGYWIYGLNINRSSTPAAIFNRIDGATLNLQLDTPIVIGNTNDSSLITAVAESNNNVSLRVRGGRLEGERFVGGLAARVLGEHNNLQLHDSIDFSAESTSSTSACVTAAGFGRHNKYLLRDSSQLRTRTNGSNGTSALTVGSLYSDDSEIIQERVTDSHTSTESSGANIGGNIAIANGHGNRILQKDVSGLEVVATGNSSRAGLNLGEGSGDDMDIQQTNISNSQIRTQNSSDVGFGAGSITGNRLSSIQEDLFNNSVTTKNQIASGHVGLIRGQGARIHQHRVRSMTISGADSVAGNIADLVGANSIINQTDVHNMTLIGGATSDVNRLSLNTIYLEGSDNLLTQTDVDGVVKAADDSRFIAATNAVRLAGANKVAERGTSLHVQANSNNSQSVISSSVAETSVAHPIEYCLYSAALTQSGTAPATALGRPVDGPKIVATGTVDTTGVSNSPVDNSSLLGSVRLLDTLKPADWYEAYQTFIATFFPGATSQANATSSTGGSAPENPLHYIGESYPALIPPENGQGDYLLLSHQAYAAANNTTNQKAIYRLSPMVLKDGQLKATPGTRLQATIYTPPQNLTEPPLTLEAPAGQARSASGDSLLAAYPETTGNDSDHVHLLSFPLIKDGEGDGTSHTYEHTSQDVEGQFLRMDQYSVFSLAGNNTLNEYPIAPDGSNIGPTPLKTYNLTLNQGIEDSNYLIDMVPTQDWIYNAWSINDTSIHLNRINRQSGALDTSWQTTVDNTAELDVENLKLNLLGENLYLAPKGASVLSAQNQTVSVEIPELGGESQVIKSVNIAGVVPVPTSPSGLTPGLATATFVVVIGIPTAAVSWWGYLKYKARKVQNYVANKPAAVLESGDSINFPKLQQRQHTPAAAPPAERKHQAKPINNGDKQGEEAQTPGWGAGAMRAISYLKFW